MMDLRQDIYYQKDYVALYLKEGDSIFEFEYTEGDKTFYQLTIKRPIRQVGEVLLDEIYYDLETAYGYGGYLCNTDDMVFIEKAWTAYQNKCKEENIVAEFVRYHPFNTCYQLLPHDFLAVNRKIVYVDLTLPQEERWAYYSSNVRNILRKCSKNLQFIKTENIEDFINLYEETMRKNNADAFYFFDQNYFRKLCEMSSFELYEVRDRENQLLSMAFFNFSEAYAHYHLSANNYKINTQNSNYFILEQAMDLAQAKGCEKFLLGGGRTPDDEDSLLKFKKKFAPNEKEFHIAGNIYNKEKYDELNQLWQTQNPEHEVKFFLKYRI